MNEHDIIEGLCTRISFHHRQADRALDQAFDLIKKSQPSQADAVLASVSDHEARAEAYRDVLSWLVTFECEHAPPCLSCQQRM